MSSKDQLAWEMIQDAMHGDPIALAVTGVVLVIGIVFVVAKMLTQS